MENKDVEIGIFKTLCVKFNGYKDIYNNKFKIVYKFVFSIMKHRIFKNIESCTNHYIY